MRCAQRQSGALASSVRRPAATYAVRCEQRNLQLGLLRRTAQGRNVVLHLVHEVFVLEFDAQLLRFRRKAAQTRH